MKHLILVLLVSFVLSPAHAVDSAELTRMAAGIWNAFATRENLGTFLAPRVRKKERAELRKFIGGLPKILPRADLKSAEIVLENSKIRWAFTTKGVTVDGRVYKGPTGTNFKETLENFGKWRKNRVSGVDWNPLFSVAQAQGRIETGLGSEDDKAFWLFMNRILEAGRLMEINCSVMPVGEVNRDSSMMYFKCPDEIPNRGKLTIRFETKDKSKKIFAEFDADGGMVKNINVTLSNTRPARTPADTKTENYRANIRPGQDYAERMEWDKISVEKRYQMPNEPEETVRNEEVGPDQAEAYKDISCMVDTMSGFAYAFAKACGSKDVINFIRSSPRIPIKGEPDTGPSSQ